jgi:hypothetical protein
MNVPVRGPNPKTPRWVKIFGVALAALALLFVILHISGHGFGSHFAHGVHH